MSFFPEEKLLHEEVHTSWEEAQRLGANGDLADELRPNLPPGVRKTELISLASYLCVACTETKYGHMPTVTHLQYCQTENKVSWILNFAGGGNVHRVSSAYEGGATKENVSDWHTEVACRGGWEWRLGWQFYSYLPGTVLLRTALKIEPRDCFFLNLLIYSKTHFSRCPTLNDNNLKRGPPRSAPHPPARQWEQPPGENRLSVVEHNTISAVPQANVHLGHTQELMMGILRMGPELASRLTKGTGRWTNITVGVR